MGDGRVGRAGSHATLSVAFSRSVGYSEKRPLESLATLEHFSSSVNNILFYWWL